MNVLKGILGLLGAIALAILCGIGWAIGKIVSLAFYILSLIVGAASVLLGGIGKFLGTLVFIATGIVFAMNGFSIEILVLLGITVVLVTSRQWLEKLAFLLSDISAAI